jgi:hypothetical protein
VLLLSSVKIAVTLIAETTANWKCNHAGLARGKIKSVSLGVYCLRVFKININAQQKIRKRAITKI